MRLIYFGTSEFAVPALRALSRSISLVVTQPDRPSGRGRHLQASPVKQAALDLGLRVETPEKARDAGFIEIVREADADALLVASYGQILSEALLGAVQRGGINLHASILPKYRGAAPIQRAILDGETETGVTLMQMDKGMDTGDIIAFLRTDIDDHETEGELEARLADMAARMAEDWMQRIADGDYPRTPQDNSLATIAAKMTPEDGRLAPAMTVDEAYRRFRAATPRPGCSLDTRFGIIKIHECRPGSGVLSAKFSDGALELFRVQPAGRRAMSGKEFSAGHRLKPGEFL